MGDLSFADLATARITRGASSLTGTVFRYLDLIEGLRSAGAGRAEIRALLAQCGIASTAEGFKSALRRARARRRMHAPVAAPAPPSTGPSPRPEPVESWREGGVRAADGTIPPGPAQLDAAIRGRLTLAELDRMGRKAP